LLLQGRHATPHALTLQAARRSGVQHRLTALEEQRGSRAGLT